MARKKYTLDKFEQELKNFVTGCGVKITNTNTEEVNQLFRNEAIVLRRIWRNEERECNIMDYEKLYKESLERAREYHKVDKDNTLTIYAKGTMEYLFPVLKEPEDEKIRKEILEYFQQFENEELRGVNISDWMAWLEKQGEQNPAWSEDDELYLEDAIHAAKELYSANCGGDELVDWLKSLKDRVQPQPQNEWSEEDERMHKASIRACQYMVEHFENSTKDYEDAIEWFNSLKGRLQPQWKPSDEQMKGIDCAIKTLRHQLNVEDKRLNSLYEQLKKL